MRSTRRTSLWAGIWFAITFVTSIAAAVLYGGFGHVLQDPQFALAGGTRIATGAFLELILLVANIATAVVLFPVLKWQWEAGALGFVTARVMESAFIMVGILSLLALSTVGAEVPTGAAKALMAVHDWTFDLGPGFVVGIGNGLLLGYMMFRSGLVPRGLAMFGLIGGPLVLLTGTLVVFDVIDPDASIKSLATIPEIIWEGGLTLYLLFKGFRTTPIVDLTESQRDRVRMERTPVSVTGGR